MSNSSDISNISVSTRPPKKTVSVNYNGWTFVKVIAAIIIILVAFGIGVAVGDHHKASTTAMGQPFVGGFRRGGGGIGTVSAVSSSSITINDLRSGTAKTYAITSSTSITSGGQSVSASSITDGERVVVIPSTSNSSDAATIIVNPSFGGGAAPNNNGSATSGSTTGM